MSKYPDLSDVPSRQCWQCLRIFKFSIPAICPHCGYRKNSGNTTSENMLKAEAAMENLKTRIPREFTTAEKQATEICRNCRWFWQNKVVAEHQAKHPEKFMAGQCLIHPPAEGRPTTYGNQSCGKFEQRAASLPSVPAETLRYCGNVAGLGEPLYRPAESSH